MQILSGVWNTGLAWFNKHKGLMMKTKKVEIDEKTIRTLKGVAKELKVEVEPLINSILKGWLVNMVKMGTAVEPQTKVLE